MLKLDIQISPSSLPQNIHVLACKKENLLGGNVQTSAYNLGVFMASNRVDSFSFTNITLHVQL